MSSSTEGAAAREIRVPRETVNDDVVTIAEWRIADGARVRRGECIVDIETSKSVLEVEADADGFVQILHPTGSEVPVGELIGRVLTEAGPQAAEASPALRRAAAPPSCATSISRKAQRLIDEHRIDPQVFEGQGLIRETDVIAHLERSVTPAAPPSPGAAPAAGTAWRSRGLFSDARASAGDRQRGLPWLILNYFWRNWLLGNLVKVAPRGVILTLHRWRGVTMGDDCFVDPSATLETAYPEKITLGHDVRVTVGAIVMSHIKAPNYLRETGIVPVVVKPVRLDDHCFIGVNAVVMPGVTVGRASVVTSGSVVVSDVPPYTMVSGNPAKVVKRFPKPDEGGGAS